VIGETDQHRERVVALAVSASQPVRATRGSIFLLRQSELSSRFSLSLRGKAAGLESGIPKLPGTSQTSL
jgi:hypothetical protein